MERIDSCRSLPSPFEERNASRLQSHPYYFKHSTSMGLLSPGAAAGAPRDCPDPPDILIPPSGEGGGGIAGERRVTGQQMHMGEGSDL